MTPEHHPGVSDFGITPAGLPVERPRHPRAEDTGRAPDPRFAMADAVRRITTAIVGTQLTDEEIAGATSELSALAERLEAAAGRGRRPRAQPDPAGHPQDFFPSSPVIGFANAVAPPVVVEAVEGGLIGSATFDYQYEGPPGCVHGGVIAMVFDELLGAANIVAGTPGMTGTLTIRYRKPTPLRAPLRLEARQTGRDGRKVFTWGGIYLGDALLAEAEGVFIELVPERFLSIIAAASDDPELAAQVKADALRIGAAVTESRREQT
jgi:acyl-coenzyme A thioesterase PaaI-like protein